MINLKNLTHTYKSKKGASVIALNNVNFTFSDKGIYFLTGKSGCGKSTLLNLLSGIDTIQDGQIVIDGEDMRDFSNKDYDNYRNNYAGIIFQEFNLIETMTVYENIDMPLRLQGKNDNAEIIAECLKKVDLEGYEDRFPSELSGGQRQRVSIARQLAKGSKVILADEPTGALDSENSKNVFDILEKLSKDTLIIIASHDLEYAETYGDVIIRMIDGEIVDVINNHDLENTSLNQGIEKKKAKFPTSYAFKFALKDILHTKIRFIIATILCFVAFALFGTTITIVSFSPEAAIAKTLINRNDEYITLGVPATYEPDAKGYNLNIGKKPLSQNQLNYVESNYSSNDYIKKIPYNGFFVQDQESVKETMNIDTRSDSLVIYNSPQDIEFYGYELADGYLPLTDDSAYITDFFAYCIIKNNFNILDGDNKIKIDPNSSVYSLVGKTIVNSDEYSPEQLTISGIINTDYRRFISRLDEPNYYIDYDIEFIKRKDIYNTLFVTKKFASSKIDIIENEANNEYFSVKYNGVKTGINLIRSVEQVRDSVLTSDSYKLALEIEKGQIVLPLSAYNMIFSENNTIDYYYDDGAVKIYPTHIGEKIKLDIYGASTDEKICEIPEVEVVGIILGDYSYAYLDVDDFGSISEYFITYNYIDFKVANDYSYMKNVLISFRDNVIISGNYFTDGIYDFYYSYDVFALIFSALGIILFFFSILIFANFINVSIFNRKKDIGIIRAVGGTKGCIFKVFLMEGIVFSIIVSTTALIATIILSIVMNNVVTSELILGTELLIFNPITLLAVPALCFAVMLLTTYLLVRKINKKSPVEIIRNN